MVSASGPGCWVAADARAAVLCALGGAALPLVLRAARGCRAARSRGAVGSPGPCRGAVGAALRPPASRPIPVLASGREMVVLPVPAEVTVILLDVEGTTTPIAFVKVRGGRERCLKAIKNISFFLFF